ncbi:hypothetical protein HDU78_006860 [Chytriomyces hyalinus]|nr:hypothetical protein HDU78_006860 [Chytriomyces hyalinus]
MTNFWTRNSKEGLLRVEINCTPTSNMPIDLIPDTASAKTVANTINTLVGAVNRMEDDLHRAKDDLRRAEDDIRQLKREAELLANAASKRGTYETLDPRQPTKVFVMNDSRNAVHVTVASGELQRIPAGESISFQRTSRLAIVFTSAHNPELQAAYFGEPKDITWKGFCPLKQDAMLSAVMSAMAPGILKHSSPPASSGVTFVNKSDYTVQIKFANPSSTHFVERPVHRLGSVEIPVGSHINTCIAISIPAMGLHHVYCGDSSLLEWEGFPEHLMAAHNTTSLIQATSTVKAVFTDGDKIDFNKGDITKAVTVTNSATNRHPVEVWNGSAFVKVAHGESTTVNSMQFANIVLRDPRSHVTALYQGVARNLTFESFTPGDYPSELHFHDGWKVHVLHASLTFSNTQTASDEDTQAHVFITKKNTPNVTLHVHGGFHVDKPVYLQSESSLRYLDGRNPEHGEPLLASSNRNPRSDGYLRWKVSTAA